MFSILQIVLSYPFSLLRPRHNLAMEVLALRHQVVVLKRQTRKPKRRPSDNTHYSLMRKKLWAAEKETR